jgi:hypothetical protein
VFASSRLRREQIVEAAWDRHDRYAVAGGG